MFTMFTVMGQFAAPSKRAKRSTPYAYARMGACTCAREGGRLQPWIRS